MALWQLSQGILSRPLGDGKRDHAMNIKKSSAKSTLFQIVVFLVVVAALILFNKNTIQNLYTSGGISKTGMIINGIIIALFVIGMLRIIMVLFRYINEDVVNFKLVSLLKENAGDPIAKLPEDSLSVQRFNAVKWVAQQGGEINQAAMAASTNSSESSRLTVIRFVHSTLILAGVFGTVVSLSMALIGAAGLLNSPEGVKEMGVIISGMSSALSSTVVAIVCFFIFAYFYLRLNDARIQVLTHIEDMTSLYLLPKLTKQNSESAMVDQVTTLAIKMNQAADKLVQVEHSFLQASDQLMLAVDKLHGKIQSNSLDDIKDLIRKGFHLSEPEYDSHELEAKALENQSIESTKSTTEEKLANSLQGDDITETTRKKMIQLKRG